MNPRVDKAMLAGSSLGLRAIGRLLPFVAFLRHRLSLLLLWPAIAVAAGAGLWGYVLADLEDKRRDRQAELQQQVDAYTRSFVLRTRRSIADTDRLLLLLRHDWAVSGHRTSLAGTSEAGIFSTQYMGAVGLLDRNGVVVTSSHPAAVGKYFGDKPYFTEQQRTAADRLYVSAPLDGQLSNREVIVFSRRLLSPGGRFDGIVLVSMLPAFFTQHYSEPILREHGFVGLAGKDGVLRASRSGSVVHSARARMLLAPLPVDKPEGVTRLEGRRWFADGRTRVVGWRPMPDMGLIGIVGVDEYSAMAGCRRDRQEALNGAWSNTAWLALAALLATSFYVHARWKQHQIETIRSTYRLATEDADRA